MREIFVLCGLPGSGKTYFSQQQGIKRIDVDSWMKDKRDIEEELKHLHQLEVESFILDGLFLTNKDYQKILSIFQKDKVNFHFWEPNREICLYNDKGRREKNAAITIKYAEVETPNLQKLERINPNISLITHTVIRKDDNYDNDI
jgi:predicted kinase